jgi:nucleoside-diphosphate-sugar epimerase
MKKDSSRLINEVKSMEKPQESIFITGAGGFIGRNIAQSLNSQYHILAPTHNELDLLSQEQVDRFFLENDIDYVIHCANIGGNRKVGNVPNVVEKNLRMFFNLSRNDNRYNKMIHFGSGAEYSKDRMSPRVKESDFDTYIPTDDYGFSKYLISKYIENADNIYCLRLFGVFGPYEDYEYKFISNAIVKNLLHMPVRIVQDVYFDWLYIDDLMYIVHHFIKNDSKERIYNVTTGKTTDLIGITNIINKYSEFKSEVILEHNGLNREYSGDNSKLIYKIGNYEFTSIDNAIQKLMHYYKKNLRNVNVSLIEKDLYASKCSVSVK